MKSQSALYKIHIFDTKIASRPYQLHWHEEIELIYCIYGSFVIVLNDARYNLKAGCVIFINSGELHEIIVENPMSRYIYIEFGAELVGPDFNIIAQKSFDKCFVDLESEEAQEHFGYFRLHKIIQNLIHECTTANASSQNMKKSIILEMFVVIVRHVLLKPDCNAERLKRIRERNKLSKAFDLVKNNYSQEIRLSQAAAAVNYSERSFIYAFKAATGMTFHNYLNVYRVERAMELLSYYDYSIEYVGYLVGLSVPKSFSRVFKQVTGMSPTEYRKLLFKSNSQ